MFFNMQTISQETVEEVARTEKREKKGGKKVERARRKLIKL